MRVCLCAAREHAPVHMSPESPFELEAVAVFEQVVFLDRRPCSHGHVAVHSVMVVRSATCMQDPTQQELQHLLVDNCINHAVYQPLLHSVQQDVIILPSVSLQPALAPL